MKTDYVFVPSWLGKRGVGFMADIAYYYDCDGFELLGILRNLFLGRSGDLRETGVARLVRNQTSALEIEYSRVQEGNSVPKPCGC